MRLLFGDILSVFFLVQVLGVMPFIVDHDKAKHYIEVLREQSRVVKNDWRQHNYCTFISSFASHFGNERCMVVGSTTERTRLRSRRDQGDYDYLIISDVAIPEETLEYSKDVPCFVHINVDKTPSAQLSNLSVVDGKYLNASLLKNFDDSVFKILRGIYDVFTLPSLTRSDDFIHIKVNKEVKPGHNQAHFTGFEYLGKEQGYIQVEADIKAITKQFRCLLDVSDISRDMISVMRNIFFLLEELRPENIQNSLTFQTFGALIEAGTDETLTWLYDGRSKGSCDKESCNNDQIPEDPKAEGNSSPGTTKELVTILFDFKSGRDFIPAFPIKGILPCLDEWRSRLMESKSFWPSREAIDRIYESEYYVIAKPAIVNPDVRKDFCIGFNNAEMILSSTFSDGQRLCFLLLKSLQKGYLKEFSERLTSYHWKTAFYYTLETTELEMFASHSGIFNALEKVLNFMVTCLEQRFLRHYFINSNLIAHLLEEECRQIISSIQAIISDPVKALDVYFFQEKDDGKLVDQIPNDQIEDLKHQEGDSSRKTHAEAILSLVSRLQIGAGNDSSKFVAAIVDTLAVAVKTEANFDCYANEFCTGILKIIGDYLNTNFRTAEDRKRKLEVFAPILELYLSQSYG